MAGAALGGLLARALPAAAKPRPGNGPADDGDGAEADAAKRGGGRCARANRKCGKETRCCGGLGLTCKGKRCRCKGGTVARGGRCVPAVAPPGACASDADCGPQQGCVAGRCACDNPGAVLCGQQCIGRTACCTDADCSGGLLCPTVGGRCRCSDELQECRGSCIPRSSCCDDADCGAGKACQSGVCRCTGGRIEVGGKCADPCQGGDCGQTCACQETAEGPQICRFLDPSVCDNTLCARSDQCPADEFCIQVVCGGVSRGRCVRGC